MTKENNQGMKERYEANMLDGDSLDSSNAMLHAREVYKWFESEISLLKKGIEEKIQDEQERFRPAYEELDKAYIEGMATAINIVRKAGE